MKEFNLKCIKCNKFFGTNEISAICPHCEKQNNRRAERERQDRAKMTCRFPEGVSAPDENEELDDFILGGFAGFPWRDVF